MKKTIKIVVLILLLVFAWHAYVAESMNNQYWDVNPLTDVATLKTPDSRSGVSALVAVPMAEQKLGVYARQNLDLYAWVIPYRVDLVAEEHVEQPPTATSMPSTRPPQHERKQDWHVISIESRITESNQVYTEYSWKLVVKNDSTEPAVFYGTVEFQDADGFKLDDDEVNLNRSAEVAPASEGVFTGSKYIGLTKKVAKTIAKISKAN
jgi:hypothetical protein